MTQQLTYDIISEEIQHSLEETPLITEEDAAVLRAENPHLYDLTRIRDKLRKQIIALEGQFDIAPSGKAVYPLINLYTKYQEIIAEIRSMEEQSQYAMVIAQNVLDPMISGSFQTFTDMLYLLNKVIKEEIGDRGDSAQRITATFDKLALEYGRYLDNAKKEAVARITELYESE